MRSRGSAACLFAWLGLGLVACHAEVPTASDDTGDPRLPPETVGTVALFASHVWLDLPDGGERSFHLHDPLIAFRTNLPFAADFDGDGLDSVGLLKADGTVRFHADNGSGALPVVWQVAPGQLPVAGDFDGDGVDGFGTHDVAAGEVSLWNGAPTGRPEHTVAVPAGWLVVAGDFDGDGRAGLAALDATRGDVELHDPLGSAPEAISTGLSGWPVAGDLDGDGVDELGVYAFDRTLAWVDRGNGAPASRTVGTQTWYQWPLVGRWSTTGRISEPSGFDWRETSPVAAGFDAARLEAGFAAAGDLPLTNSLLVAHRGRLVREAYWRGFDATRVNNVKSVSKSLLSALFGIAVAEGALQPSDRLSDHLPTAFGADPRADITVEHLMTMTTGLAWDESGTSIADMVAADDWVAHVTSQPLVGVPGTTFNYSTGNTHVASALLEAATGEATRAFATRTLFDPLGIGFTRWDEDPQGIDFGGAEVWMRPRDLLRFGQLYLDGGQVDGVSLLDPAWIEATFTEAVPGYGRWWWAWTLDGASAWAALGYGGQLVVVVPDRDLVVVATSEWSVDGPTSGQQIAALYDVLDAWVVPAAP